MSKKAINMFYALSLIFHLSLAFHYASYALFLQDRGLNLWNMNLVNVAFMLLSAALEMPTGALADKFGRKRTVIASCFIAAFASLIYFFSNNFWAFVFAECVAALGMTLHNGALQAWLFDSLKHHAYLGDINEIQRKENQFSRLGVIIGSIAGGYVAMIDIAFPWLASVCGLCIAGFFCMRLPKEGYREHPDFEDHSDSIFKIAFSTFKQGLKNKHLLYLGLFELILLATFQGFNMQWTILFKNNYDISLIGMGWIMGTVIVALSVGSFLAKIILNHCDNKGVFIVASQVPTAIFMIFAALFKNSSFALSSFFLHEITRGIFEPLRTMYVNRHGKTKVRATVHSFNGMMGKLGATLGLVFSGMIAQLWSIKTCWITSGFTLLIATILFIKFKIDEK